MLIQVYTNTRNILPKLPLWAPAEGQGFFYDSWVCHRLWSRADTFPVLLKLWPRYLSKKKKKKHKNCHCVQPIPRQILPVQWLCARKWAPGPKWSLVPISVCPSFPSLGPLILIGPTRSSPLNLWKLLPPSFLQVSSEPSLITESHSEEGILALLGHGERVHSLTPQNEKSGWLLPQLYFQ